MMKCEETRSFVDAWENGDVTSSRAPEEFRAHLESCPECSRRFGSLLPFMERDLGLDASASPSTLPAGFADDVMSAIESRKRPGFVLSPLLAAAAAAIFVVGLGFGIFFTKLNSDTITVSFLLDAPQAKSVYLAGDFNAWSGDGYALRRVRPDGKWEIKIPLKKGKVYVYNFVVDGTKWIVDPSVPARVDDGFGGSGSLLRL